MPTSSRPRTWRRPPPCGTGRASSTCAGCDYGLRGLEVDYPASATALRQDPAAALAPMKKKHVPLLYWTAAAWGAAMALRKTTPS